MRDYDLKARTLFGKVYPNRETVQDVLEIYNDMKRRLNNNPSPQQCANIRYRLEALDLAEEEKVKVRKLIFECENKKELKKIRSINFVAILLLIGMIAIGACLPITATPELHVCMSYIMDRSCYCTIIMLYPVHLALSKV